MKVSVEKLELILARKCQGYSQLRANSSPKTITKIRKGEEVSPKAVGTIAKSLGVDVEEIVEVDK